MLKTIAAGILTLVIAFGAVPATAQDTIGVYADFGDGGELSRSLITKVGEPFDIVVVTKTNYSGDLIQFEMTELQNLYAGVFKYTTTRFGGATASFGDEDIGEQVFGYGACAGAGENEILRIRYHDVNGSLPENVVVSVFDPGPDNSYFEMLNGVMMYSDCYTVAYRQLVAEPWDESSGMDPTLIEGVTSTDGILVLNPQGLSVSSEFSSLSTLKSRF